MKPFKQCTCCAAHLTRAQWDALPPAPGGLRAYGLEWRNHFCHGPGTVPATINVSLSKLRTVRPVAETAVAS